MHPRIAILGAGVAGLCMAMQLRRAGLHDFTIFEKADRLGGTWRDNTYPGCGCDVPSHLYCFSFEPNPHWSRGFAEQHEILAYLQRCASKYELDEHIRFETEIAAIRYVDDEEHWELTTAAGEVSAFDIVISGTGQLNRPFTPDIAGRDTFAGTAFHSARWRHDHDLSGRDVAVIGNGASALQLIPHVAAAARRLTVFQRSAHWIVQKPDRTYWRVERWLFERVPALARLHRYRIYWALEARFSGFREGSLVSRLMRWAAERELSTVQDEALREKLTPDYPIGCKRILISNDYYEALQRNNVHVVDDRVARIVPEGVATEDQTHPVDTIIFATGFESTRFLAPMEITGRGGVSLSEAWRDGAEAYLGMTVPSFPNFFMLYGPNTNLGHSSIIFMIECQTRYVVKCLQALEREQARSIEVTRAASEHYNDHIQDELSSTVWAAGCDNWYRNPAGRITNNWASYTTAYWWRTREPDLAAFLLR